MLHIYFIHNTWYISIFRDFLKLSMLMMIVSVEFYIILFIIFPALLLLFPVQYWKEVVRIGILALFLILGNPDFLLLLMPLLLKLWRGMCILQWFASLVWESESPGINVVHFSVGPIFIWRFALKLYVKMRDSI